MEGFFEFLFRLIVEGLFISDVVKNKPYLNVFLKFILITISMTVFLGIGAFIRDWTVAEFISKLIYPPLIGGLATIIILIFESKKTN